MIAQRPGSFRTTIGRSEVKHATEATLKEFSSLLARLDRIEGLKRKKLGVYYFRSKAFLHFHEEGRELYADLRTTRPEFERYLVTSKRSQELLIDSIEQYLGPITCS